MYPPNPQPKKRQVQDQSTAVGMDVPPASDANVSVTPAPAPASPWSAETLGTLSGYRNSQTGQWLPGDHPEAAQAGLPQVNAQGGAPIPQAGTLPPAVGQPAPGGVPAAPGQGANTPIPTGPNAPPPATINDAFRQMLMTRMAEDPTKVDRSEIDPQMGAFRTAQQRSMERQRAQLAESAALEGTNTSGGAMADRLGLEQQRGETESAFEATLVGNQLQAKRERINQALQMAMQYGTAQDQLAAQEKLAMVDAELRRLGITTQRDLGNREIDLRRELGTGQLGLGRDTLGLNFAQLQAELNRQALLAAMGGAF